MKLAITGGFKSPSRLRWKDHPIHLRDALTGELRNTYRPFNHVDEVPLFVNESSSRIEWD